MWLPSVFEALAFPHDDSYSSRTIKRNKTKNTTFIQMSWTEGTGLLIRVLLLPGGGHPSGRSVFPGLPSWAASFLAPIPVL